MMLADARHPLTVVELIEGCQDEGVVFGGRASKIISDALRWEVRSGRVRRLARGVYAFGSVPRSTMRWIGHRVEQTRCWLQALHAVAGPRQSEQRAQSREPPDDGAEERADHWVWPGPAWVPGWPCWPSPNSMFDTR